MYSWLVLFSLIAANSHLIKLYPPSLYLTTWGDTSRKLMFLHRSEHLIHGIIYCSFMDVRHTTTTTTWYREIMMMSIATSTGRHVQKMQQKMQQTCTIRDGTSRREMGRVHAAVNKRVLDDRVTLQETAHVCFLMCWPLPRRSCPVCLFIGGRWCESRLGFCLYFTCFFVNSVFLFSEAKWWNMIVEDVN